MNNITLENYADLRDFTRKFSEEIHSRLTSHVQILQHQFRPGAVLGSYVGSKESPKNAAAEFAQFKMFFKDIAVAAPLSLDPDLPDELDINSGRPVLTPFLYGHSISTSAGARHLTITAPLRLVLTFPEYSFHDLRMLLASRGPKEKIREFALHYALLNYVVMRNKPLISLFEDLRFPIRSECFDEFGKLPITIVEPPAGGLRAPDALLVQICKFSGAESGEELIDLDAWNKLPDPLVERFREESAKFGLAANQTA